MTRLNFTEYFIDLNQWNEAGSVAEMLGRGTLRECPQRPEEGNSQCLLK